MEHKSTIRRTCEALSRGYTSKGYLQLYSLKKLSRGKLKVNTLKTPNSAMLCAKLC